MLYKYENFKSTQVKSIPNNAVKTEIIVSGPSGPAMLYVLHKNNEYVCDYLETL